jgi:CubicO group peptidase (beta-lactamase class C family)
VANEQSLCTRRTLLKGLAAGSAACVMGDVTNGGAAAAAGASGKLPRSTPGALGIDPASVLAFIDGVEQKVGGLHSFMLVRHGKVAAEGWWAPYAPEHPHILFSLSKSFASTAVGLAVSDGRLTVDAPVVSFFKEDLPSHVDENLAAMRVWDLLTMSTGHDKDATGPTTAAPDGNWVKAFLALPVQHKPGTHFVYNSAATYMLSAIVQNLTGATVLDYLKPRLLAPLGIEGATWESCPRGINKGGWGLSVKTEDIARFGQLYLQRGKWSGRQLIPETWVDSATNKQVANGTNPDSDWSQGYGYQFWRCRHGAYRGDGAFGQYCVVMPEQDAVLAITSGVGDMQAVLNVVWEHLLPGMKGTSAPSSGTPAGLTERLKKLEVRAPEGKATSPAAKRVSGKTYRFEGNDQRIEAVTPTFRGDRCSVVLRDDRGEHRIEAGGDEWVKGTAPLGAALAERRDAPVAARGAWVADDTYAMKVCYYETPFIETITWKFTDDQVTVTRKMNVGFGPTERPALVGRSA